MDEIETLVTLMHQSSGTDIDSWLIQEYRRAQPTSRVIDIVKTRTKYAHRYRRKKFYVCIFCNREDRSFDDIHAHARTCGIRWMKHQIKIATPELGTTDEV